MTDAVHTAAGGLQSRSVDHTSSSVLAGLLDSLRRRRIQRFRLLYDPAEGNTTRLGYVGAEHTASDGRQASTVTHLNAAGVVAGLSTRYQGHEDAGQSAWLYDAATGSTTPVGYTDAEHTRLDGTRSSEVLRLTDSGYAVGTSERYLGSDSAGRSLWLHDLATGITTRLGFYDADHTRQGYQHTSLAHATESGYVTGVSRRSRRVPRGGFEVDAYSAWIFDVGTGLTTRLGFFDAEHTTADGAQSSEFTNLDIELLTESGWVGGISNRYAFNGIVSHEVGQTGWVYHAPGATLSEPIVFEEESPYSRLLFVGEGGVAAGGYAKPESYPWPNAFAWDPDNGGFDLASAVEGGIEAAGWELLIEAYHVDPAGRILGVGKRLDGGHQLHFLLRPVPEAAGGGAVALASLLALARRTRVRTVGLPRG